MQVAIVLFPGFTSLDAVGPYDVLVRVPDAEVVFCAAQRGAVRADPASIAIVADATFDEVVAPDVVVVPGGFGTRPLMRDERLLDTIRQWHTTSTWTTSVCTGSLLLGAAGLLQGLTATTHWGAVELLESTGARYVADRVVEHERIMMGAGVSAGIDMALTLAARLTSDDVARAIQLGIEYDPQPPFDAGSPDKAGPAITALLASQLDR